MARRLMYQDTQDALVLCVGMVLVDTFPPGKGFTVAAYGAVFLGFLVEKWLSRPSHPWMFSKVRIASLLVAVVLATIGYDRGEKNAWFALAVVVLWLAVAASRAIRRSADARSA